MNREKAIKILRKISPFILPAPRDRDAIRFAIDFMENHQKPTEHETAQDTEHESMSEGVEMELVALNILNRTFTFLAGEEGFDVREGKYLIKRIDQ